MTQDHGRGELETGVAAADEPDVPPASAELRADISDSWSWASAAAGIPQVGRIEVRLPETVGRALLVVPVVDEDREIGSTVVHDGRLEAGEHEFGSRTVPLAAAYMAQLDERGAAKCVVELTIPGGPGADAVVLARVEQEIDIDPRDMPLWDATPGLPKEALGLKVRISNALLASFVRPTAPGSRVLRLMPHVRDLYDPAGVALLSDEYGRSAVEAAGEWLQLLPHGGTVHLDDRGYACALRGAGFVYLGRLRSYADSSVGAED